MHLQRLDVFKINYLYTAKWLTPWKCPQPFKTFLTFLDPYVYCPVHNTPGIFPNLSEINTVDILPFCFLKLYFILIILLFLDIPKVVAFFQVFLPQSCTQLFSVRATCPDHLSLLDVFIWPSDQFYKPLLFNFLEPRVIFSFSVIYIRLCTLLLNNPNACCSLLMGPRFTHAYWTKDEILFQLF